MGNTVREFPDLIKGRLQSREHPVDRGDQQSKFIWHVTFGNPFAQVFGRDSVGELGNL